MSYSKTKILLINPNKWGRGITALWIPSHTAILKNSGHDVRLFDCTFYSDWTFSEVEYNTKNLQYKPTEYFSYIKYNDNDIYKSLQKTIDNFRPEIIFFSALSSHMHGEGEYVNIQYGYELIKKIRTEAIVIAGGLQATAAPETILHNYPKINFLIRGESELVLAEVANKLYRKKTIEDTKGLVFLNKNSKLTKNPRQSIINNMDKICPYDYSIFEDQVFFRPYNGKVLRAVDYELSRGCIYACEYCVETVIQKYYGFNKTTNHGVILNARNYLRNKSPNRIFEEITDLTSKYKIKLFRCQDTNFLTINNSVLNKLANLIESSSLDIILYIETRPEGITPKTIDILKRLKVDGVGLGIELSGQEFRKHKLKRFSNQNTIIKAFKLLKDAGIKRTAYNIIGLPDQDEQSIIDTIKFNNEINPDNVTVAFYSPYLGTPQQEKSKEKKYFSEYEYHLDGQLRTLTKEVLISKKKLEFYKSYFNYFVINGLDKLNEKKFEFGIG